MAFDWYLTRRKVNIQPTLILCFGFNENYGGNSKKVTESSSVSTKVNLLKEKMWLFERTMILRSYALDKWSVGLVAMPFNPS